jgi:short subunit dehydrogenase-like uncharacterized protein
MPVDANSWMLYGANGYTGRLIARRAAAEGKKPILAGRDAARIESLARELDCPYRVFPISTAETVAAQLTDVAAILLCAGPFFQTAAPTIEACLRARVNYLDITGEVDVIEAASRKDEQAKSAGISIMPAVGFDVVPSDCLAAKLAAALPDANHLELAFTAISSLSPGTATTMFSRLAEGGVVRSDGRIVRVPLAWKQAEIQFPSRSRQAITIPWGDVASAYHTTGIPNIEVYMAMPPRQIRLLRRFRWLLPITRLSPVQWFGRKWIKRNIHGPSEKQQAEGRAEFWGRVTNPSGATRTATLTTPEGYSLTATTALAIVDRVLQRAVGPGFWTPAKAFGPNFIDQFAGVAFQSRN